MATKAEILEFSLMIEDLATTLGLSHMDAIVHHCSNTGLEIEVAATMISPPLKAKIAEEAEKLHQLKRTSRLPV